jgi:hypothetical protein
LKLSKVFLQEPFVKLSPRRAALDGTAEGGRPHMFITTCSSPRVRLHTFVPNKRWECERFGTDRRIFTQYGCVVSLGMLQVLQPGPCTRENRQEKSEAQSNPSGIQTAARRDF